jgi:hypothetical protein
MRWMVCISLRNPSARTRPSTIMFQRGQCRRRIRLTTSPPLVGRLSGQCGIRNISEPYRPPRPVMGIVLLLNACVVSYKFMDLAPNFVSSCYAMIVILVLLGHLDRAQEGSSPMCSLQRIHGRMGAEGCRGQITNTMLSEQGWSWQEN